MCSKHKYNSVAEAQSSMKRVYKNAHMLTVYSCPACGYMHTSGQSGPTTIAYILRDNVVLVNPWSNKWSYYSYSRLSLDSSSLVCYSYLQCYLEENNMKYITTEQRDYIDRLLHESLHNILLEEGFSVSGCISELSYLITEYSRLFPRKATKWG